MFKKLILFLMLFVSTTIYALSPEQADSMYQVFQRYGYDVIAIFNERSGDLIINNQTDTGINITKYSSMLFTNLGIKAFIKFLQESPSYDYKEIKNIIFRTGLYEGRVQKSDLDYFYLINDRFKMQTAVNTFVGKLYESKK